MEDIVKAFNLRSFASIKTTRKTFSLDEITIDLDETDFGYKLAELEILIDAQSTKDLVDESISKINTLAKKLGKYFLKEKIIIKIGVHYFGKCELNYETFKLT